MRLAHFYHAYAGEWRVPVAEHMAALADCKFDGPMYLGLVGNVENRAEVEREMRAIRAVVVKADEDAGWEQVTLREVLRYAQENDGAVLYAHTKGAANPSDFQHVWRQWMTRLVVKDHRPVLADMQDGGFDAAGCHWLTPEMDNAPFRMFGGNFWIATCEYLRTLPTPGDTDRHEAEAWIGLNDPRVINLLPGWPGRTPLPRISARRLATRHP